MFFDYLKGLGLIISVIAWVVIFNWGWWRFTKEKLWEAENPLVPTAMPFILPIAVLLILLLPLIVQQT